MQYERYVVETSAPDKSVVITGSTHARVRLYRMALNRHLTELEENFLLFGLAGGEWASFEATGNYEAFMVQVKKY